MFICVTITILKNGAVLIILNCYLRKELIITGVEVGLSFFELENGFKISLRSATTVPVNKLAAEFNGGGHFFAAGARLENRNMDETIPKVIETGIKYIQQYFK